MTRHHSLFFYGGVGRGCGVGRGLGVALGVAVGVGVTLGVEVGVGVTVGVAVGVGVGVGGGPLYNSALALMVGKSDPPAASTMPLDSKIAVCRARALLRLPVNVHVPLIGS
jgi:hypothetical protein